MKFNIISNIRNGAGLEADTSLMLTMLRDHGHDAEAFMFNEDEPRASDVNIFLEVIDARWMPRAKENWIVPNSEWWFDCWDEHLRHVTKVLCKTRDCYNLWCNKVGTEKCVMLGWEAKDIYDASVPREKRFLHLAGKSETKNTAAVAHAWRGTRNFPPMNFPLTVSAFKPDIINQIENVPNIKHVNRFTADEVRREMNACLFHIMPSKQEGYGHAIHEALSCGAIVITLNAPSMNESAGLWQDVLIPATQKYPRLITWFYDADPDDVSAACRRAFNMGADQISAAQEKARAAFLKEREAFRAAFGNLMCLLQVAAVAS